MFEKLVGKEISVTYSSTSPDGQHDCFQGIIKEVKGNLIYLGKVEMLNNHCWAPKEMRYISCGDMVVNTYSKDLHSIDIVHEEGDKED